MKKLFLFSFLILNFSFLITSCCCKKKASSTVVAQTNSTATSDTDIQKIQEEQKAFANGGYNRGRIIYNEVDGCGYMIQLGDGAKLEPTNLKDEFKKDKLDVWVKYTFKKGGASICMAGQIVDITDIQLRK